MKDVGSLATLRELNRLRVVDELRRRGSASRSDLARLTGLSRTTVTAVVGDLQANGLVVEAEDGTAQAGRGRPPVMLRLDPSAGLALGVDFGHSHVRVAVADLSSTVLAEAGVDPAHVVGAGMGVPGPFDRRTGRVSTTMLLPSWQDLSPGEELAERIGVQVEADNDANMGALGEATFGAGQGYDDLVYVKVATGIGAGLVLDGRLYRGARGIAGELGHIAVVPQGPVCMCGGRGCLQSVAATPQVLTALRAAHGPDLTLRGMLDLVGAGDAAALRVINDAGRSIGRVLADLCNHVNPSAIVVGGDLSGSDEPLLAGIRESIDRYALKGAADTVEVLPGVLGDRAEVLGAIALVVTDTERLRSAGLAALAGGVGVPS